MFYPISRDHTESGTDRQEPWEKLGTDRNIDDLAIRTKYIRERYALMPYIYTMAEEASRSGIPMMRRMFLEFPGIASTVKPSAGVMDLDAETQFMFGANLLVAPSPVEQGIMPFGTLFEAENARRSGSAITATDHAGFSGSGFVSGFYPNPGATITTTLKGVPADGRYALQVRYANATGSDKTVTVSVDGISVDGQLTLPRLANWDTWGNVSFPLNLTPGDHTLAISYGPSDSGNVNFDSFAVTAQDAAYPVAVSPHTRPYDALMPPGQWYDYWTGKILPEPKEGTSAAWNYTIASPSLKGLPVFVRGGSIIPRLPEEKVADVKSTRDVQKLEQLELAIYPGDKCAGTVYMDAGDGFGYQKGDYYRRSFTCTKTANQITVSFGAIEGTFTPSWKTVKLRIYGLKDGQTAENIQGLEGTTAPVLEQGSVTITRLEPKAAGTLTMSLKN
ncbi:DUF5110 domain-containing protein [Phyllobacterium sp. LjRoot231]|uniref:DUF5110 domain-containing protein n=1 Tax=Phyllobacterium sp. LjRoot231 TaxID=3342289 RepID=UPI003ECE2BC5